MIAPSTHSLLRSIALLFALSACDSGFEVTGPSDLAERDKAGDEEPSKERVLTYWQAVVKNDQAAVAALLHQEVELTINGKKAAVEEVAGTELEDAVLMRAFFHKSGGVLVYRGRNATDQREKALAELVYLDETKEIKTSSLVRVTRIVADFQESQGKIPFPGYSPVQFEPLVGDHTTEANAFVLYVPAGMRGYRHTHRSTLYAIVLEGTIERDTRNGRDRLLPGSGFILPKGEAHNPSCVSNSECVLVYASDGPFAITAK
jgi:quercetin dioxygenase-like cupin family protein